MSEQERKWEGEAIKAYRDHGYNPAYHSFHDYNLGYLQACKVRGGGRLIEG